MKRLLGKIAQAVFLSTIALVALINSSLKDAPQSEINPKISAASMVVVSE